ncbi:MAG: gamma-glutamyltransferase [Oligoflexia bacterium]|nr:gamma-glutamyltransferase [Oligoflexia bacterium]
MKKLLLLILIFTGCSRQVWYRTTPLFPGEKIDEHLNEAENYMVVTQGSASSKAGEKMFELGGNGVDAATAVSFAISVERPQSTGIGGGGFLLLDHPTFEKPISFDFREKAPLKGHSKMYLDKKGNEIPKKSLVGIHAVGVPGLVKGILEVHAKYGKLPLKTVLRPSIDLARKGMKVYPELAKALRYKKKDLEKFPSSKKIFFKGSRVLKEGEILFQKDLADTLERIAKRGSKDFYHGLTAKRIVATSKKYGGMITMKDMKKYHVVKRDAVSGTYNGNKIFSMGPPSSGGVHVLQILNTVEPLKMKNWGPQNYKTVHYTAAAMQQAFSDRAKFLGDPDFVKVPIKELTSKSYAEKIRREIPSNRALKKSEVSHGTQKDFEHHETTHFSIYEKDGYSVSSTQTINGYFGSSLVAEGTGIVLNNEMDDFATKVGASNLFGAVGGENNLVEAEKRPLSSMSPTIVRGEDGKVKMVVGTPSGTRILTCVAQTILNYLEHEMNLLHSVAAVRYHHQWSPDEIRVGEASLPLETENKLREMGYKIRHKNLGCRIQAIAIEDDEIVGVSDNRGQGMATGK